MRVMLTACPLLLYLVFSQAGACFYCISRGEKRIRVCEYFVGYGNEHNKDCLAVLWESFDPFVKYQVAIFEMEKLKDIVARSIFYLEEKGMAKVPYREAIPEAAEKVRNEIEELKGAVPCIPPCGFQKMSRFYNCKSCRVIDCPLPIDCPVQYIHKAEDDITILQCSVKFVIPAERIIKWRFAKNMKLQDLSFFEELYTGTDMSFLIRPTRRVHQGMYACEILEGDDVLVRKYMYLNVTTRRLGKEKELQSMFHDILNPPPGVATEEVVEQTSYLENLLRDPNSLHNTSVLLLLVGLFLSSMVVTLLLMGVYYWATDVE